MALPKVQSRGQVTLPLDIRRSAGISAGDRFVITVEGPGEVRLKVYKSSTLDELLEKYPLDEEMVGKDVQAEIGAAGLAQGDILVSKLRAGVE